MGLKIGRKNQGGGDKSGDEGSPSMGHDLVHKPHFSRKLKPHMPHQLERTHLRRPGSPKQGDAPGEEKVDAFATTETTTSSGHSSKGGLSLKNPFSRKKHQHAKRSQEKDAKQQLDESPRANEAGTDGAFIVPPGTASCKDITRQHTEAAGVAPVSYKSFGHKLDCGSELSSPAPLRITTKDGLELLLKSPTLAHHRMQIIVISNNHEVLQWTLPQQLEQGHMARYGDIGAFASRDKMLSTDLDNGGFSIHRYDTSRGKILQQVSLAGVCAEAAQAERQQAIVQTLAGKTWREKLQWGLDRKNLGNTYYQQKKISEAISAYEDCLLALDFGSTPEEQQAIQQQLQLPVVLNLAACMLAIKCYQKCKSLCDVALTLDSTCLKAVFRKGLACFHLGELGQARENLLQAHRFCCGHLPGPAEIAPDGTESSSKPESSDPAFLSLVTAASKEFSGRPVGEEKEKFVKKVNHYLRSIATQEKQYAAACQNMFKCEPKPGMNCNGTSDHQGSSFWKSPLGGFTLSPCNLCAKRNEKAQ